MRCYRTGFTLRSKPAVKFGVIFNLMKLYPKEYYIESRDDGYDILNFPWNPRLSFWGIFVLSQYLKIMLNAKKLMTANNPMEEMTVLVVGNIEISIYQDLVEDEIDIMILRLEPCAQEIALMTKIKSIFKQSAYYHEKI
jgi:hypothetical protein